MKTFFAWLSRLFSRIPAPTAATQGESPDLPNLPTPSVDAPPVPTTATPPSEYTDVTQIDGCGDPTTYGAQSADINDVVDENGVPR